MPEQPNPPDRDDAVTEHAVSMDTRPAEPAAGAGRAVNAAFSRRRPEGAPSPRVETTGQQDLRIEGPGYPSEDMDDVDPEDDADEDDGDGDEEGYREGEEAQGLETGDGQLPELMPDRDASLTGGELGVVPRGQNGAPGMQTGDGQLDALLAAPGGDDLGGDRDDDPNLNGGHGISMQAPEEGPLPIEDEPTDLSIIGHGHEDKAAWNRERVAHLQDIEEDERPVRPATSESLGLGGAALAGAQAGWEGGNASPTIDQGTDPEFDDELSEEEEVLGDMRLDDAGDILDDESINDPNNTPFLPEHRDLPDDNVDIEERLIASDGEDSISAGAELGVEEELDMEDLNETDDISQRFEDQRETMDNASEGNERRGGVEDD